MPTPLSLDPFVWGDGCLVTSTDSTPNLGLIAFLTKVMVITFISKLVPILTLLSTARGIPGPVGSALSPS